MASKRKTPKKKAPPRMPKNDKELARQQIRKMFADEEEEIRNRITDQIIEYAFVAAGVAVFDTFGTAGEELDAFNRKFCKQFDCIVKGTVSLDDLKGLLEVEAFCQTVDVKEIRNPEVPILVGAGVHQRICWQREIGTIKYWADKYGLKPQTVRGRLKAGWDVERALTTAAKGSVQE